MWTEERFEMAKALAGDGWSARQIASRLGGVTRNAVIGKMYRNGLKGGGGGGARYGQGTGRPRKPSTENDRERWRRNKATPEAKARARERMRRVRAEERAARGLKPREPRPRRMRPEAAPAPNMLMLSILQLEPEHCRFPIGDPRQVGFGFCAAPKEDGKSYCPYHCGLAYQPDSALRPSRVKSQANYF